MCMLLWTKLNISQHPVGSSGLHHLYDSADHSPTVMPCTNVMQTKLLKVVFLYVMNRSLTELVRLLGTMWSNTWTSYSCASYSLAWICLPCLQLGKFFALPVMSLWVLTASWISGSFWGIMKNQVLRGESCRQKDDEEKKEQRDDL